MCISGYTVPKFPRILSIFGGSIIWAMTRSVGCIYLCARKARAWASMLTELASMRLLIFGRIIFTFSGNLLRIATSCMAYVVFMFSHRVSANVVKRSLTVFGRIFTPNVGKKHTAGGHNLHEPCTCNVHVRSRMYSLQNE
jgi:hypothetical protein